jgi:hypothetical protein
LKTVVYLRAVYQFLGKKVVDRRWFKFYPKPEPEIFSFNENESLIFENSFVGFEVIKKLKYRRVGFTVTEESYQVLLEEFLPLDNTLKEIEGTNNLSKIINLNLAESENKITNNLINRINEVVAYQVNISREATINSIIRFFTGGV